MPNLNPSDCCETTSPCCDRLPDVLKATFTNVLDCAALHNVEVMLVSDGTRWNGQTTCGSESITLSLYCPENADPSLECEAFELEYNLGCMLEGTLLIEPGCTCDPVNFVFEIPGDESSAGCTCCNESPTVYLTITITV